MAAELKLSEELIQAAKAKINELQNKNGEPIVLDSPFSNFSIIAAETEPKNSFFKFSLEDLPEVADLEDKNVFIISDKIN